MASDLLVREVTLLGRSSALNVCWVHVMTRSSLAAVLALTALPGLAQETTTGSVSGLVVDAQSMPVPGAAVIFESAHGARTVTTDTAGRFFAFYLTPGRYTLRVELTGFMAVRETDVEVRLGQRLDLRPILLRVGQLSEAVSVLGTPPVIDVGSTTVGGILDSDSLKRLPVGRQLTDSLYLVPGVSESSGLGQANPSIGGGTGLENSWMVDGVNVTNTGYGGVGSFSAAVGSLGTGVTTDLARETQVKTAGFEAEYGQSTGGVVNVVTHSGGNRFHGSAFAYWRGAGLESDWRELDTPGGAVDTVARGEHDFGLTLGGPLLRDRLFVFGAMNPQFQSRTLLAPEGFPLHELGPQERNRRALSYAGKLTWQAGPSHRLDLSFFGDPGEGEGGPQRAKALLADDTSLMSALAHYGGHNQVLKYDGILSRSWLVEVVVARSEAGFQEAPLVDQHLLVDFTSSPARRSGGLGAYEQAVDGENRQVQLRSTHIFEGAGSHQLRLGASLEDVDYARVYGVTGPAFALPDGTLTRTGARVNVLPDPAHGRIYRVAQAFFGEPPLTHQKYVSLFLQDTWQVGGRLTLRPGLRWEQQRLAGGTPVCHGDDSRGTGAGVPCAFTWSGSWAPRLGLTWDLRGDGRSKLFASWGRFFARLPNGLAVRALSADAMVGRADYYDAALARPVPEGELAAGTTRHFLKAGQEVTQIDPASRPSYLDEWAAGLELEPVRDLAVGARFVRRRMPRVLEDVGALPAVAYDLAAPGLSSVEYTITNVGASTPVTQVPGLPAASFEDPRHIYNTLEVFAQKLWADDWSLVASYRWSRLHGNFEGFFRSDNRQSDPGISSLFDFPTNDPSYALVGQPEFGYQGDIRYLGCSLGCGPLPNDRTHQGKLYGSRAFGRFNLGLGVLVTSGRPLTALAAHPVYGNGGEIPLTVRGAGFQTTDGFRHRTPVEHTVDLHADYTFRFGERRLMLIADVFNVLDRQTATDYDNWTEYSFGVPNPNFGQPVAGGGGVSASYQAPRSVRLGARFEW